MRESSWSTCSTWILACHIFTCILGTTLGRAIAQIDGDRRLHKPLSNWTLQNVSLILLDSVPREDGTAKKHRPTLSHTIYLPTGAILVTVIVFPSVATSPVNWTLAPAFATSAAKF